MAKIIQITDKSCIKQNKTKTKQNKTRPFSYSRGVPLYLNNLPHSFENKLFDPFVLPHGKNINSLLYADDLVILSRSKTGLQNCLNALSLYCDKWKLKINPKKTRIMTFQKRPKKSIDIKFNIGSESIEIVQEYTCLATRLTSAGNVTLVLEHLKRRHFTRFRFSIRKQTVLNELNPNTASQTFETMMFPILSYNSEVRGMHTKQDFKKWDSSPIEKNSPQIL